MLRRKNAERGQQILMLVPAVAISEMLMRKMLMVRDEAALLGPANSAPPNSCLKAQYVVNLNTGRCAREAVATRKDC